MKKGILFLLIFCLWLIIAYNLSVDYITLKVFAQIEEPQQPVLDKKQQKLKTKEQENALKQAEKILKAKEQEEKRQAQLKQKEELAKPLAEKKAAQQREKELAQQKRQQELSQKEQESKAKKEELARQKQEQLKKQEEEKLAKKQQMQKKAVQKKTAEKKEESVLPPKEPSLPAEAEKEKSPIDYIIAEGDAIEVFVWQNPDLTKSVSVGPDGKISYPLVGRLQAAGLTIEQLESEIRKRISKFVKYPQVSIMMTGYAGNKVIILGEVNSPAVYTFKGSLNLIEAIAMAGDFTGKAQQDSVIVVRGNLTEQPRAFKINMTNVIKKGTSKADIVLQPNDVIYVSRSLIHDVDKFLANFSNIISNGRKILDLRKDIMNRLILER